ncbi:XF1762 family protein [Microbispora sp. H10885]|uniref:XF1762 family protein n=1 Tax=Microbispora sp. H10885 TaxID=2729110 RepID=UPI0015FF4B72|nr:XF1762 family protein [Microbispora sp. H10885]
MAHASGETCPDYTMGSRNDKKTIANEREGLNSPERPESQQLVISPVPIQTARAFIAWTQPRFALSAGAAFALGVQTGDGTLVGVALIGWPTAWAFDDGDTAEVLALATDGTSDASRTLLCGVWLLVRELDCWRLIAYTRIDDPGTDLWDAGFRVVPRPIGWHTGSRAGDVARVLWAIRDAGGRR